MAKIADEYREASTSDVRERLLALHFGCLNLVESQVVDGSALAVIRDARRRHYYGLLLTEVPTTDGIINDPADLRRITDREVAAGRMEPDDDMRYLAVHGVPRPAGQTQSPGSTAPASDSTRTGFRKWVGSLLR